MRLKRRRLEFIMGGNIRAMNPYQSYRNLPPLAGLCSFEQAMSPGLSIDECVARLKRFHYAFKRLHQIFTARLTSEPVYELKMGFSLHAYLCAEHVDALRKRVGEMREPPLGLEVAPDENLALFFDEILAAPGTKEVLTGLYGVALPALRTALATHVEQTNLLADAPSVRLCRFALLETDDMLKFGAQGLASLVNEGAAKRLEPWRCLLGDALAAAGGLDGAQEHSRKDVARQFSARPFVFDKTPQRDARFPDPYNMGVNAEVFLYDETMPPDAKVLMMFYKRLREIDVPEMMAGIIAETSGKPWSYYRDMTRQLWDEARHAMMGEVGFASVGVDWPKNVMVNFTWSLGLNTQLTPIERHGVLYFIEQGLMPKNGKRYEWEVGRKSNNPLCALFQDYDWADEVLHAQIGRRWLTPEFGDRGKLDDFRQNADICWKREMEELKSRSAHEPWWDQFVQELRVRKKSGDPRLSEKSA